MPYLEADGQQHLMLGESSSLSEVQALPALILDTSLETADDPETNDDDTEDTDTGTCDNEDIVWRTSQYYGIDLVTFSGDNSILSQFNCDSF